MYYSNHANQGGRIRGPPISFTSLCNCLLSPVFSTVMPASPACQWEWQEFAQLGLHPQFLSRTTYLSFLTLFQSVEIVLGYIGNFKFFRTKDCPKRPLHFSCHITKNSTVWCTAYFQHGAPNSAVQHRTLQYTPFALLCVILHLFTFVQFSRLKFPPPPSLVIINRVSIL